MTHSRENKRLIWNFEIHPANPLVFPKVSGEDNHPGHWESRYFWPEEEIIVLKGLDNRFLDLFRYQIKHRQDTYCLLPDKDYNLKIRRNETLYKPLLMKTLHAMAYGKKINLGDHKEARDLSDIHAPALLARIEQEGQYMDVEKDALIYRLETEPVVKLELARLRVANAIYFSVNIESRSKCLVESISQQMFDGQACCDYVTFLKKSI